MNLFKSKKVIRLEDKVRDLEADKIYLQGRIDDNQNEINKQEVYHKETIGRMENNHTLLMNDLQREYDLLESDFDSKLEKAIKDEKAFLVKAKKNLEKDYESKTKKLEKDYEAKFKQLNKEHVEKLAKMDAKLEADKASYRKYIRQENNKQIETFEKDIKSKDATIVDLRVQLAEANGKIAGLERTSGILQGQVSSTATALEKTIDALPTVTAEITTPEVVVQMPKQEGSANKGGSQGGGDKSKA